MKKHGPELFNFCQTFGPANYLIVKHQKTGYEYIRATGPKGILFYKDIPTTSLKHYFIKAFEKDSQAVIDLINAPVFSVITSKIGKFMLNLLLIPSILSLIIYAFMKPIMWGAATFVGLCILSLFMFFIFKRIFIKKQPKGE